MAKLAKDSTLQEVLAGLTGAEPDRTAYVQEITFTESQFESGYMDTSTGQNKNGSGFLRTSGYISLRQDAWKAQLFADKPWIVRVLYYDSEYVYQEYEANKTGCVPLKDYPYCRLYFYQATDYLSNADFITTRLKIQYIVNAPAENEYFLHNYLFNSNFEFDRNSDNVADGWDLRNSPTNSSVSNNTQFVIPSTSGAFLRMESDNRMTGHQIYVAYSAYTPYDICSLTIFGNSIVVAQNTEYTRNSKVVTAVNSDLNPTVNCGANAVSYEIGIRNIMMIDLTDIYGAGSEPTASQIDEIIDTYYDGYVPCEYTMKYDDRNLPVDVLTRLSNLDKKASGTDVVTMSDGAVASVGHYVDGALQSTTTITRDNFGNIVSIEEA